MSEQMATATLSTDFPAPAGLPDMDACFVIGGDGTLLNLMEQAAIIMYLWQEYVMDNLALPLFS